MITYHYRFTPRFSDTDAYEVFHHAAYYYWFEEARFSFSKEILQFNDSIAANKAIKFPVIESYCKYKKSIVYTGQELEILLQFFITKSNKIVFEYKVIDDGKISAVGKSVHVLLYQEKLVFDFPQWFLEGINGQQNLFS